MPIIQISSQYQDFPFGTTSSFLKSNTGDTTQGTFVLEESIQVTGDVTNSITNNPTTNTIEWIGGDFDLEGFRVGDTIEIVVYTVSTGVVLDNTTTTVNWINGSEINVASTVTTWYSYPDSAVRIKAQRNRQGLELFFNMVGNGSQGSEYSLIDGEVTRFQIDLTTPASPVINQVGNKSGAYALTVTMGLISSVGYVNRYSIVVTFVQSGIYNSNLFDFNNCLKVYLGLSWQSLIGEPFSNTLDVINQDANTGWFNQAHNGDVIDATLVQGINDLAFDSVSTVNFVIDSSSLNWALGSAYISGSDAYFKNQPFNQSELAMLISSDSVPVAGSARTSATNPDGAKYNVKPISLTTVGTQHTVQIEMTPNGAFTTFMANRQEGDRTFYLWARWGAVNILLFSGQLSSAPVVAGTIPMVSSEYFDHSQQSTDTSLSTVASGYAGNVEDDFGWVGKWRWPKKATVSTVKVGIQAYDTSSLESFTLQQTEFSLNNVPQESTGLQAYILDLTAPVNPSLPTTSVKREVRLVRDTSIDQPLEYGVRLYYPYLYRWEYWLQLLNANADFYPDEQTRNWVPYGNTGNWSLRIFVKYVKNGLEFEYFDTVVIKDYDSDANIVQDIQLNRISPAQTVQTIIEGELMKVVATHTIQNSSTWDTSSVWGMITVEPTASSPRNILSTNVAFDGDTSNPLTPLSGSFCDLTFPSPNVARMECFFDPSKINLSDGVKFTTKIKGCQWP